MTVTDHEEYKLPNGQSISIQKANTWEVACWNKDDTAHWYKEFDNEEAARKEFERFRK
jgi:hypothetical protein